MPKFTCPVLLLTLAELMKPALPLQRLTAAIR